MDTNKNLPDDGDSIEEASTQKMPVGTEDDSVASVDKAEDGVKSKSPTRKGDSTKQDPAPKTKAGLLNAMNQMLSSMGKADLNAAYSKMSEEFGEFELNSEEEDSIKFTVSEELKALAESEETLSDEFKSKTAILFDTAVKSEISENVERLEEEYQTRLDEELEGIRTDLVEKVDSYFNYVVENWMKTNELAIENGLRTEVAEDFMSNLKDLFVESYISVPESKVDLVDELVVQVDELEEKHNTAISDLIQMKEEFESLKREAIISESGSDLATTQLEKLRSLVESLEFEDEESFTRKVQTVKESYFKGDSPQKTDDENLEEDWNNNDKIVDSNMAGYLDAIGKIR